MRVTKAIDASVDQLEKAKESAVALLRGAVSQATMDLFFTDNLEKIEDGIRQLNLFSQKSWILSGILIYTLVINQNLYEQSGLTWAEYASQSRERLGLDKRDISNQLSCARFYVKYHDALERRGFEAKGANNKLARAETALELSHDLDAVLDHLVKDTWDEFKTWYQSFKKTDALPKPSEYVRSDIGFEHNRFTIGDVEAVKIADDIPEEDKLRLQGYMKTIFEAIAKGYEPAIIPVYDKKEASLLTRLRDQHRQEK